MESNMIIQYELESADAKLANLNTRVEKAGDEDIPACDLHISLARSSDDLVFFAPTLKAHLFLEHDLDLAGGMALRYPEIDYPLAFEGEMSGACLTIETGVSGKGIVLADVRINKFRITPMAGGSVIIGMRVQCKPDEKQIGKLYMLQAQSIKISLVPAELPKMSEAK